MTLPPIRPLVSRFSGVALGLWWIGSFLFTHMPAPESTTGLPYIDKVAHVFIYLILAFLLQAWWHKRYTIQYFIPFLILIVYAVIDELLQQFVGRTPDIWDGIADVIGIVIGLIVWYFFFANKKTAAIRLEARSTIGK